jgi:phytoene synthase
MSVSNTEHGIAKASQVNSGYNTASDSLDASIPLSNTDLHHCRRALNNGSKSFLAASHLLPAQVRNAATALYAFCREADDLVDHGTDQPLALQMVQARIERVFGHEPLIEPSDRALRAVVKHYDLPRSLLDALVEGFCWDADSRTYANLSEVESYGARVAGTVGAMMAILMGIRDKQTVARACDLGVAMQLTNICRDVGEDARSGRCYLPLDWLAEAGVSPDQLLEPQSANGLQLVIMRVLHRASQLYSQADSGIAMLPRDCRRGIRMARHLYANIGHEIARANYDVIDYRAFVPLTGKLALIARHWRAPSRVSEQHLLLPPSPETAFLVDAVVESAPAQPVRVYRGLVDQPTTTGDEMVAVLKIIDRLEHASRHELRAGSGKLPYGYTGVIRR